MPCPLVFNWPPCRAPCSAGDLDSQTIELEVPPSGAKGLDLGGLLQGGTPMGMGLISITPDKLFSPMGRDRRRMTVAEARPLLEDMEADKMFPQEVRRQGVS